MKKIFSILLLVVLTFQLSTAQETELFTRLKQLRNTEVAKIENTIFSEAYVLMVSQPVDHSKPGMENFKQRVFLFLRDTKAPVVFVTEGYAAHYAARKNFNLELAALLNANVVVVEHRNFGKSVADTITWKTMTVQQAAADHHAIREMLKPVFPGKWVSTGVSKGGQTALYYKAYYPSDVDATVAYVAPINFAVEDDRLTKHMLTVGAKECRDKILEYQTRLLKNKDYFVPAFTDFCAKNNFNLLLPPAVIFDYEVLEYPFSFWQYGTPCDSIPDENAPKEKLLEHLLEVVTPFYYSKKGYDQFKPFFYQANYELGYYGYDETPFKAYLEQADYKNTIWAPTGKIMPYKAETLKFVNDFLQNRGDRIIYIYGEYDPWSASQVNLTGKTDALKVVIAKGNHSANIAKMDTAQKQQVYSLLEKWMGCKISLN